MQNLSPDQEKFYHLTVVVIMRAKLTLWILGTVGVVQLVQAMPPRSLCSSSTSSRRMGRQDPGQVVGILTPETVGEVGAAPYLPDLGFWADVGGLLLGRNPSVSPLVRLSRDIFESQQCAEWVSCEMAKLSRKHSPFQFIHSFLEDFPFQGDLAKRLKLGSTKGDACGFHCHPLEYLNRGVKTLTLLHSVMDAANLIRT